MSSSAAVVLLVCVVVCLEGHYVSGYENIKEGEKIGEKLSQVLEELHSLRDEISNLKDADQNKADEINQLKDEDKKNKEEMNNLKDADTKKTDEINHLKDEISNFKGQSTNSKAAVVGTSAFMAVMDRGYKNPEVGDVIHFEVVLLNVGQNYDPQTSIFTCAQSGLYLFSVTLYSGGIKSGTYDVMSSGLIVDGVMVAEIVSTTSDPIHAQTRQSAVTVVVECPQGGKVWVESQWGNSQVFGLDYQPRSFFTGYAISYYIHP